MDPLDSDMIQSYQRNGKHQDKVPTSSSNTDRNIHNF